jgi:hypothetical protein
MVTQRITSGPNQIGILLLDRARINRYDIAVPFFGLLAWLAFERAARRRSTVSYFGVGALIGCASLSHLYGGFWLIALAVVAIVRCGWLGALPSITAMLAGLAVTWVPWLVFIASGWSDYVGQMRFVAPRFQLVDLQFYLGNVFSGDGPIGLRWAWRVLSDLSWTRFGTWLMVLGVPTALVLVARSTRRDPKTPVATLASIFVVQLVLFLLLIRVKTISYMIALWPLAALLLAWLLAWTWQRRQPLARAAVAIVVAVTVAEAGSRFIVSARAAEAMTPADFHAAQIARCIPEGSRVLGFQHYWVGLRQFTFETWLVPILMSAPATYDPPLAFDAAIERVDPDVILIDRHMRDLLGETQDPANDRHYLSVGFERYKTRHPLEPVCSIRDRTYGTLEVYRIAAAVGRDRY